MDLSQQVKSYQDVVRIVVPLLKERAQKVGESFEKSLSSSLESGQNIGEGKSLLLVIAKVIENMQEKLEKSDMEHARELGDDAEPRARRDEASQSLYFEMTGLRDEIEAVYGSLGIKSLSMEGATPTDPPRLERFARDIAGRLANKSFSLGKIKRARVSFDRLGAASDIASLCDTLKHWLGVVDKEAAEAKTTQEARTQLLKEWQDKVPKLCQLAKGIFLVAGDIEGAALISARPPRYRRKAKASTEETKSDEVLENSKKESNGEGLKEEQS